MKKHIIVLISVILTAVFSLSASSFSAAVEEKPDDTQEKMQTQNDEISETEAEAEAETKHDVSTEPTSEKIFVSSLDENIKQKLSDDLLEKIDGAYKSEIVHVWVSTFPWECSDDIVGYSYGTEMTIERLLVFITEDDIINSVWLDNRYLPITE